MSIFRTFLLTLGVALAMFASSGVALGQPSEPEDRVPDVRLGEEYTKYKKTTRGRSAPEEDGVSVADVLLYLPNRFLDLIDIIKVDVGAGPAFGGVVRVTKWGQVGMRSVSPFSLRVGAQGRRSPVFLEHSSEFGIGPAFVQSHDRVVGSGEVGAGIDFIVLGAYIGIDFSEIPDFLGGFFTFDPSGDDLE